MRERLFAPTLSFVWAKRMAIVLSIVFIGNMFLLAIAGHATVLRIYVFAILWLACCLTSCLLCWKLLVRYEPGMRILFSFIIPGPLIFNLLLWLNYLTAKTHTETYRITGYGKESEKPGNHNTGVYIINLENGQFADYKEFRMFEPYLFDTTTKSISYEIGTGCLGIEVVKGYSFNNK